MADIATWLSTDASLSTDTADTFAVTTAYDALDRVTEQTAPDSSRTVPTYDAGGRLSQVEVYVRGDSTATEIVSSITTNARGQREQIVYGNHTQTSYAYDPERLWLTSLTTTRSSASSHGAATLQDLGFTRDAVGNITEITDDAQETVYFGNSQVSPTRTFTYDALYRLVSARGREKDAQTQSTAFYADYAGAMGGIPQSGSGVLRRYTQSFEYDAAGNILEVKHQQGDAGTVLWRRGYAYETDNNQLLSTSLPGDDPDDPGTHSQTYAMNDRGAIVYLPHLKTGVSTNLVRDFRDQLRKAELDNAGNVSWYAYDAAGERVWKVWDKGSVVEERIYLGGYEVWRKRNGSGVLQEERQTVHVMDDQRRVAMIETLTVTGGSAVSTPTPRFRYQLDDQLGSALLEVDDHGGVISYEEYHPYGTTAWWAEDAAIEVSRKRYRYTGKERDEETGLQYHSARYYAPWLGRWDRPDPIGLGDGGNRWGYCSQNPDNRTDLNGCEESLPWTSESARELSLSLGLTATEAIAVADDAGIVTVQTVSGTTTIQLPYISGDQHGISVPTEVGTHINGAVVDLLAPSDLPRALTIASEDLGHFHIVVPEAYRNDPRLISAKNALATEVARMQGGTISDASPPNDATQMSDAIRVTLRDPMTSLVFEYLDAAAAIPGSLVVFHTFEEIPVPHSNLPSNIDPRRYSAYSLSTGSRYDWPTSPEGHVLKANDRSSTGAPPGYVQVGADGQFSILLGENNRTLIIPSGLEPL